MKTLTFALVSLAACTESPPTVVATGNANDSRFTAVLSYLQQQMMDYDIPGASIAIVDHGQLYAAAGVGTKREGETDQVEPSTLFRVASLSKLVTASTAMSLVESGELALDHPVTDYAPLGLAPGFDPSSITVADLLDHTSGIPDLSASTDCSADRATWFAQNASEPLWTSPGEIWNYSNRGYGVAGWAIEGAAKQTYEDVAAARVFGPAGMTTATFDVNAATEGDHAVGHVHDDGGTTFYEPDAYTCAATRPAGGVIASALDYASLAQTLLANGGAMLQPGSVAELETGYADPHDTADDRDRYGYGLYVRDGWKGLHVVRHSGEEPGYESSIWMVPDQQFAVVVMFNATGRKPSHVAERAIDEFLDVTDVAAPDNATAPSTWAAFAGDYYDPYVLGDVSVRFDGNALYASASAINANDLVLTQVSGNEFSATLEGKTGDLTFYPDANGTTAWLVTREGVARHEVALP